MLEIRINTESAVEGLIALEGQIQRAVDAAVRETSSRIVVPAIRASLSHGGSSSIGSLNMQTGRLVGQVQPKFWMSRRSRLTGSAVRVRGDRSFIMHILEFGAKSHGGRGTAKRKTPPGAKGDRGPLAARLVFRRTFQTIHAVAEHTLKESFERHLKAQQV